MRAFVSLSRPKVLPRRLKLSGIRPSKLINGQLGFGMFTRELVKLEKRKKNQVRKEWAL